MGVKLFLLSLGATLFILCLIEKRMTEREELRRQREEESYYEERYYHED